MDVSPPTTEKTDDNLLPSYIIMPSLKAFLCKESDKCKNTKTPQPNQSTSHSTKRTFKVTLLALGVDGLQ